jgi:lipopolysaccharide export system permease protein
MTWVIPRYFAWQFVRALLSVFVSVFVLVALINYVEDSRRAADVPNHSVLTVLQIAVFRVPQVMEKILPFSALVGAMFSYMTLSRRMELVVTRAAGMSAWQFVAPAVLAAVGVGTLATMVYNPLSAYLNERSIELQAEMNGRTNTTAFETGSGFYLRQRTPEGQSIVTANSVQEKGLLLGGVAIFTYDADDSFHDRIVARSARLLPGKWVLDNARVFSVGEPPQDFQSYSVETNLTPDQVTQTLTDPDSVPFWQLPSFIQLAQQTGLSSSAYNVRYQALVAQPFLLAGMVLFACSISLRMFRTGGIQKMVIIGLTGGFANYILTKIATDFGNSELLSATASAWLPVLVCALSGGMILLFQEDG